MRDEEKIQALNLDVVIQVEREGGDPLYAYVRVFGIGRNVTTEIRTTSRATEGEQRAIEEALEEIVSRETGGRGVTVESEHFTDEREMRKSMRKHLGGGQG